MKKLFIFLLSLLFLYGCNYSYKSEKESPEGDRDTTPSEMIKTEYFLEMDSTILLEEEIDMQVELEVNVTQNKEDSIVDSTKCYLEYEDTLKRKRSKRIISIKADTTSILPELKQNLQIINKQQKILDSLLKKK